VGASDAAGDGAGKGGAGASAVAMTAVADRFAVTAVGSGEDR